MSLVPAAQITYRYKNTLNGFAAWLTDAELVKLASNPGVRAITADTPMPLDTKLHAVVPGHQAAGRGVVDPRRQRQAGQGRGRHHRSR